MNFHPISVDRDPQLQWGENLNFITYNFNMLRIWGLWRSRHFANSSEDLKWDYCVGGESPLDQF